MLFQTFMQERNDGIDNRAGFPKTQANWYKFGPCTIMWSGNFEAESAYVYNLMMLDL